VGHLSKPFQRDSAAQIDRETAPFDSRRVLCCICWAKAMAPRPRQRVDLSNLNQEAIVADSKTKLEWTPLAFEGAAKAVLDAKKKAEALVEQIKPLKEELARQQAVMVSHLEEDYRKAGLIKTGHEMLLSTRYGWAFASSPKKEKKASRAVSPADIKAFLASKK
jgi:hypothetical protein